MGRRWIRMVIPAHARQMLLSREGYVPVASSTPSPATHRIPAGQALQREDLLSLPWCRP